MLVSLTKVPTNADEWASWSFSHRNNHDRIRQAIQAQRGINLPQAILDPIPFFSFTEWLQRNQKSHADANGALGLQSTDLLDLDPLNQEQLEEWVYAHYLEHQNLNLVLKIS
jgi:hypothetical protein